MTDGSTPSRTYGGLIPVLWVVLSLLLTSLVGVAIFLLVKMDFFTGRPLEDEQLKSLWAFLGVALGAVVTLIGTLLTEQHNRRTAALTREAGERENLARQAQDELGKQSEKRLTLDTVAKLLELITDEGGYAQPARVGGAIATLVELEGGTVALRILGELWEADRVSSGTAVWLIDRVLSGDRSEDEQTEAATLLAVNAHKLIPAADDPQQDRLDYPPFLVKAWPRDLNSDVRNALLVMAVKLLLARELAYWKERPDFFSTDLLYGALADDEYRGNAALVLKTLLDHGLLAELGVMPYEDQLEQWIRRLAEGFTPAPWFAKLLEQFEPWGRGEPAVVAGGQSRPGPVEATEAQPRPQPEPE
jgi:hypothetical protein